MDTRILAALALAAALTAAWPAAARADEAEDRIARLERMIEEQARQIEALRGDLAATGTPPAAEEAPALPAPVPALPARPPLRGPGATPPPGPTDPGPLVRSTRPGHALDFAAPGGLRWGGYATLEYVANSTRNSFFDLHRAILQFDGDITECVDVAGEVEFEHGGIGGGRTGDVEVEHFTVRWHVNDALTLKFGAPLIPFARFNLYHDDPINDFTIRPWTARYLIPTGFGQPGVGVEWACPLACGSLSVDALVTNGFEDDFTNSGGVRGARQAWNTDNNESKQVWARVAYTQAQGWLDFLEIGLSGTWSRYDDADDNDLLGFAFDWLVRKGPFEFKGEYIAYDIDRDALDPATAVRGMDGLWAELAFHFMPCALQKCRSCVVQDVSHFTLALRYQTTDLDDRVTGASFQDDLEGYGIALNYRLTESTVFRIDHMWMEAENAPSRREFTLSVSTYF